MVLFGIGDDRVDLEGLQYRFDRKRVERGIRG
jgi:hypothetical protein